MLKSFILFFVLVVTLNVMGQGSADSSILKDSTVKKDSLVKPLIPWSSLPDSLRYKDSLPSFRRDTITLASSTSWRDPGSLFKDHSFFRFTHPTRLAVSFRQREGKETLFYVMIGLLLFFAIIRNGFGRYIQDVFKIFFRTTVRQRQIKEQLLQSPLPSLLLNIFFMVSMGMFLALVILNLGWASGYSFWALLLYSMIILVVMYFFKFVILKFIGWILQVREAADTYIFIVFLTNKVIGIMILPFIIVLAFTYGSISQVALTSGLLMIAGFFAYRYFLSFISVYRQLKISFFHFLLYLFAFEIVPLLLINKLLFTFLVETS